MQLAHIGITGGIAEGKTTVLRYLREAGYKVASADSAARSLMSIADIREEVASIARLGPDFAPSELRDAILDDVGIRREVNAFLHPK